MKKLRKRKSSTSSTMIGSRQLPKPHWGHDAILYTIIDAFFGGHGLWLLYVPDRENGQREFAVCRRRIGWHRSVRVLGVLL